MELASPISDTKGGTLLLSHEESAFNYKECRTRYDGLIKWAKETIARCQKLEESKKESSKSWFEFWR